MFSAAKSLSVGKNSSAVFGNVHFNLQNTAVLLPTYAYIAARHRDSAFGKLHISRSRIETELFKTGLDCFQSQYRSLKKFQIRLPYPAVRMMPIRCRRSISCCSSNLFKKISKTLRLVPLSLIICLIGGSRLPTAVLCRIFCKYFSAICRLEVVAFTVITFYCNIFILSVR